MCARLKRWRCGLIGESWITASWWNPSRNSNFNLIVNLGIVLLRFIPLISLSSSVALTCRDNQQSSTRLDTCLTRIASATKPLFEQRQAQSGCNEGTEWNLVTLKEQEALQLSFKVEEKERVPKLVCQVHGLFEIGSSFSKSSRSWWTPI